MPFVILVVAVAVFIAAHQYVLGWDTKTLISDLSFTLLELGFLAPLILVITTWRERSMLRRLKKQYSQQAFDDIDLQLIDDVAVFFRDLVNDLDLQFSVRRAGRGTVVTRTDWDDIFSYHQDRLEHMWKLSNRLSTVYVPVMVMEVDHPRYGRMAWLNSLFWRLDRDMSWRSELEEGTENRLSKDQKDILGSMVTSLAEMGKWLREGTGYGEHFDVDPGIKLLQTKFRYLVSPGDNADWLDTADSAD